MIVGVVCAIIAFAVHATGSSSLRTWLGHSVLTAALFLHAPAAEAAIRMLNCTSVQLPQSSIPLLDGRSGYTPLSTPATQTVRVLADDPFFVCFEGRHTIAGGLAILALVVFVCALPVWALTRLWRSRALNRSRIAVDSGDLGTAQGDASAARADQGPTHALVLGNDNYLPRFWYLRLIDVLALLVLVVNQALAPRPSTAQAIVRN